MAYRAGCYAGIFLFNMNIEALFKAYYRPLCLYAMHYLAGNSSEAEDIVQECFVKLWQHIPVQPRAFLYTAVRNGCIDYLRRTKPTTGNITPFDLDGAISDSEAQETIGLLKHVYGQLLTACPSAENKCC